MSWDVNRAERRTTIFSPSSSHSKIDPGPMPSFRRTPAGTEICPCAVTLERASAMPFHYHGNALPLARLKPVGAGHARPLLHLGEKLPPGLHRLIDVLFRRDVLR